MLVLSALEFGSAAYGSARKTQLEKLNPIHNKGLRITLGAFCISRTQNLLDWGKYTPIKITTKPEHPTN
jgi:hypothetical protein